MSGFVCESYVSFQGFSVSVFQKAMFASGLVAVLGLWIGAKLAPLAGEKLATVLPPAELRITMSLEVELVAMPVPALSRA